MKLEDHEADIRHKLLQHREVIDPDEVWVGLQPQLHPKKKKRRFILFWIFGSLGFLFLTSYWISHQNNPYRSVSETRTNQVSTNSKSLKPTAKINESIPNKIEKPIGNARRNKSDKQPKKLGKEISAYSSTILANEKTKNSTLPSTNISLQEKNLISHTDQSENFSKEASGVIENSDKNNTNSSPYELTRIENNKSQHSIKIDVSQQIESKINPTTTRGIFSEIDPIAISDIKPIEIEGKNVRSKIIPFIKPKSNFSILLAAGWGDIRSTYQNINKEDQDYVDLLNQVNSGISSQHVELGLRYNINNWFVQTGLNYNRLVNRTKLHNVVKVDTTINGIQEVYYLRSGDKQITEGQIPAIIYRTQNIQWHTYRHLIDIPIVLGYEIGMDRFSLGLNAGVDVNLAQQASGAYLNRDGLLVKFNPTSSTNPYKNNYGISYRGGIQFGYALSNNMTINLEGKIRSYSTQKIQFDKLVNEKIHSKQINLGVLYRL